MIYPWQEESWKKLIKAFKYSQSLQIGNILVYGEEGSGSIPFAIRLCKYLLCKEKNERSNYCDECNSCRWFDKGYHHDFYYIGLEDSTMISIDQTRNVIAASSVSSVSGAGKVILCSNLEAMNRRTSDTLLKAIEDADDNTSFICSAINTTSIAKTLLSRMRQYPLPTPHYSMKSQYVVDTIKCPLLCFDFEYPNKSRENMEDIKKLYDIFNNEFLSKTPANITLYNSINFCGKNILFYKFLINWQLHFCEAIIIYTHIDELYSNIFSLDYARRWSKNYRPEEMFRIKESLLLAKRNLTMGLNPQNILTGCSIAWQHQ